MNQQAIKKLNANDTITYINDDKDTDYSVVFKSKNTFICQSYANENEQPQWLEAVILMKKSEITNKDNPIYIYPVEALKDFYALDNNQLVPIYEGIMKRNIPVFDRMTLVREERKANSNENEMVEYIVLGNSRWVKLKQSHHEFGKNNNGFRIANTQGVAYLGKDKNKPLYNKETYKGDDPEILKEIEKNNDYEETIFIRTIKDMVGKFIVKE